jgi:transcription antitermination factor NusG
MVVARGNSRSAHFAPIPFWGVVRSQPQRERFAASQLELRGYETFLPLVAAKGAGEGRPLFASYFFCRVVDRWHSINFCFGVVGIIRVGDCPSRMPDHEVDALKAMMVDGFVRLPEAPLAAPARVLRKGQRVKIVSGPFTGQGGIFQGQTSKQRELILLAALLGGPRAVAIPAASVAPA